jgi:hypothetical protein
VVTRRPIGYAATSPAGRSPGRLPTDPTRREVDARLPARLRSGPTRRGPTHDCLVGYAPTPPAGRSTHGAQLVAHRPHSPGGRRTTAWWPGEVGDRAGAGRRRLATRGAPRPLRRTNLGFGPETVERRRVHPPPFRSRHCRAIMTSHRTGGRHGVIVAGLSAVAAYNGGSGRRPGSSGCRGPDVEPAVAANGVARTAPGPGCGTIPLPPVGVVRMVSGRSASYRALSQPCQANRQDPWLTRVGFATLRLIHSGHPSARVPRTWSCGSSTTV